MRRSTIAGVLVFLMGCISWVTLQADPTKPLAVLDQPFKGKVLSITSVSMPNASSSLEGVEVRQIGDQYFLTGVGADSGHPADWQKGKTIWLNVKDIGQIVVFSSVKDLQQVTK